MVWCAGYGVRAKVDLDIKSFHSEVKASKSVKRFQRDSQFSFAPWTPIKVPKLYLIGTTYIESPLGTPDVYKQNLYIDAPLPIDARSAAYSEISGQPC